MLPDSLIPFSSFPSAAEDGEPRGRGGEGPTGEERGLSRVDLWRWRRRREAVELTGDAQSASLSHSCKTGLHPVAPGRSGFGQRVPLLSQVSTARRYQGLAWTSFTCCPPPLSLS